MNPSNERAVCGVPASLRCPRCKVVYCSKAHQALVWPSHKMLCGTRPWAFVQPNLTQSEAAFFATAITNANDQGSHHRISLNRLWEPLNAESGETIERALRRQNPSCDPLEEFWKRISTALATMDPATRNLYIGVFRHRILVKYLQPNQLAPFSGPALYPFLLLAEYDAFSTTADPPFPTLAHTTLLHRAFEYHALQYFVYASSIPEAFGIEYLELAFERWSQVAEAASAVTELPSSQKLRVKMRVNRVAHEGDFPALRGVDRVENARILQEAMRVLEEELNEERGSQGRFVFRHN